MGFESFRTERLVAERLDARHLHELLRMHGSRRVMATLGGVRDAPETGAMLETWLAHWDRHGFGLWIFREAASGEFAGRAGLQRVRIEGGDEVELAYALMPGFWDRGLATEMAARLVDLAFGELALPELVSFTLPGNRRSRRVMEKVGFAYERDILHAGLLHVLCRARHATARGPGLTHRAPSARI